MEDRYLFKGKRIDNGEWVEGYLVYDNRDKLYRIIMDIQYSTGTCITTDNAPRVDSSTICQCTGLKDKNGKLIWENDVVKQFADCNELGNSLYFFYQIRWNNEYSAFEGYEIYTEETVLFPDLEDIEVIGNIFDNPELLESEEK